MVKISSEETLRGTMHIVEAWAEMLSAVYEAALQLGHDVDAVESAVHVYCDDNELGVVMGMAWGVVEEGEPELMAA